MPGPEPAARDWRRWLERLHATPERAVLAVTGGGSLALSDLLATPGASATVLEAVVPYAEASLGDWLGGSPDGACSPGTALAMASAAYRRATVLTAAARADAGPPPPLVGLGCTCSLASDRPKRGPHRVHVATQTGRATRLLSVELARGARDRGGEEEVARRLVLRALAAACGLAWEPDPGLGADESLRVEEARAEAALAELWSGARPLVWWLPGRGFAERPPEPVRGLLCGSFNPLHAGHAALRAAAATRLGADVAYELSLLNADKPPLDFLTLERRLDQFAEHPVLLSRAATFVEKARLARETTFVVGVDTAQRLLEPRFYRAAAAGVASALAEIRTAGCRFLVAGRRQGERFLTLRDIGVPAGAADLFDELPENAFRADVSSSELRAPAAVLEPEPDPLGESS